MNWIQSVQRSLSFIEAHLLDEDLTTDCVARNVFSSNAHFQRIFSIITGVTIADYIRCRKMTMAGMELIESDVKIIDVAMKYGYDTPESFTKAFTRFHGVTPSEARRTPAVLKCFEPIFLRIEIRGGLVLNTKMISTLSQLANSDDGENYYFNAMARQVMVCFGETKFADYSLFGGITGDIFTQFYRLNTCDIKGVGACDYYLGLCGIVNVFHKIGYMAESFSVRELQSDYDYFLDKIRVSIDKGIPVIWYHPGMVGVIVGYEGDGKTLLYLNGEMEKPEKMVLDDDFFKNSPDTSVYNEHNIDTFGWVVVSGKTADVSLAEIYRNAILELPKLLTMHTDEYVFGANAFRAWADDIENGKYDNMTPEDFDGNFFAYDIYVLNLSTNSGGCQSFLQKAQELNPDFAFLEDVRKQYRITNYLWNGGYWINDVHSPEEREEMKRLYGDYSLETLGGAFGCKLETLQDKNKRAPIVKQMRRFAACIDEVVRILNENLPA